jgi:hypothetical protein
MALFGEAIAVFLNGEPDVSRLLSRDLVNGTIWFEGLAAATGRPTMDNLTLIFWVLRQELGWRFRCRRWLVRRDDKTTRSIFRNPEDVLSWKKFILYWLSQRDKLRYTNSQLGTYPYKNSRWRVFLYLCQRLV